MSGLRRILLLGTLLFLIIGAFVAYRGYQALFGPAVRFEEESRILLIPTGSELSDVVDSLVTIGALQDGHGFLLLAERKNYGSRIRPGRYRIANGISLNDLLNKLRSGEQEPVKLTFNNIARIERLAGRVSRTLEPDSLAFLSVLRDPAVVASTGLTPEQFIGLFIPDTYEFWWTTTPEQFVERMGKEYHAFWTADRLAKAKALGLSREEVSALASIVQAETMRMSDAPIVAGVYLNRLRIGMPLQADPTLKFALGLDSISRVLDRDKEVDSPYNTYKYNGLPPGPINMPERRFLEAVLNAEKHDYLYFCARADLSGYSEFARSYREHLRNARRYQRELDRRKIYR